MAGVGIDDESRSAGACVLSHWFADFTRPPLSRSEFAHHNAHLVTAASVVAEAAAAVEHLHEEWRRTAGMHGLGGPMPSWPVSAVLAWQTYRRYGVIPHDAQHRSILETACSQSYPIGPWNLSKHLES